MQHATMHYGTSFVLCSGWLVRPPEPADPNVAGASLEPTDGARHPPSVGSQAQSQSIPLASRIASFMSLWWRFASRCSNGRVSDTSFRQSARATLMLPLEIGSFFIHSNALVESTIQRALRTPLLGERPRGRARQLLLPSVAAVDYCDLRKKAKYQLRWISCTSENETRAACASSSIQ